MASSFVFPFSDLPRLVFFCENAKCGKKRPDLICVRGLRSTAYVTHEKAVKRPYYSVKTKHIFGTRKLFGSEICLPCKVH